MIRLFTATTVCLMLVQAMAVRALPGVGGILDRKISLVLHDIPLSGALAAIEVEASVKFAYSASRINLDEFVSVEARDEKLGALLKALLDPLGISYSLDVQGGVILLTPFETVAGQRAVGIASLAGKVPASLITGTVADAKTGEPMAGVNVMVKGTTRGTTTDMEGRYSIEAEDGEILVFSFIGYTKHEVLVGLRTAIDIALEQDVASLDEVVVNAGYYKVPERMKTGSIVKITAKEIERQPVTTPLTALQGRVPGLEITPASGVPGSAPKIRIRGQNSLRTDGNYPLYIVDGVPVLSAELRSHSAIVMQGGVDPLSALDPASIESVEILKDADATAIYGSRGANGVVIITTKKGHAGVETGVEMDFYQGLGYVPARMDLLSKRQYFEMRSEAFKNDGQTPSTFHWDMHHWDTTRSTDWQEALLGGTANISDAQVSISGGGELTSFRLGAGYHDESLVLPGDLGFRRANAHASIHHTSRDNRFHVLFSGTYGVALTDIFADNFIVSSALTLPPHAPRLLHDGELNWEMYDWDGFELSTWVNPLSSLLKTHEAENRSLIFSGNFGYELADGLTASANLGYTDHDGAEYLKEPISYYAPQDREYFTATSYKGRNERMSWILEPQLTYTKVYGSHALNAVVGASWQSSRYAHEMVRATGYTSDALLNSLQGASSISYTSDTYADYRYTAAYGRVGYVYNSKYLVNLTARRDGSSRFGPERKFGNFGAAGIAWIFSQEPNLTRAAPFLSFGKVRVSYGSTGSDQISDYRYYNTYSLIANQYQNSVNLVPSSLHNPDFGWEHTVKLETALELGLLDDRLWLEVAWYRNRSSNQLVQYQLPGTTGFPSVLANFNATVENSGLEIMARTSNVSTDKFTWSTSLNLSFPRNELVRFPGIEDSPYAKTYKVGLPLSIRRLYKWAGVNQETGVHEFEDVNQDGAINDDDKVFLGPLLREYYGGVSNTLSFKRFDLSFLIQFSRQNSTLYMPAKPGTSWNQPTSVLDRWKEPGDIADVQRFNQSSALNRAWTDLKESSYNEEDASFLRLKTVSLRFRAPSAFLQRLKLDHGSLYFQGQNLLTITTSQQLDPETGTALPPLCVLSFGLQVGF